MVLSTGRVVLTSEDYIAISEIIGRSVDTTKLILSNSAELGLTKLDQLKPILRYLRDKKEAHYLSLSGNKDAIIKKISNALFGEGNQSLNSSSSSGGSGHGTRPSHTMVIQQQRAAQPSSSSSAHTQSSLMGVIPPPQQSSTLIGSMANHSNNLRYSPYPSTQPNSLLSIYQQQQLHQQQQQQQLLRTQMNLNQQLQNQQFTAGRSITTQPQVLSQIIPPPSVHSAKKSSGYMTTHTPSLPGNIDWATFQRHQSPFFEQVQVLHTCMFKSGQRAIVTFDVDQNILDLIQLKQLPLHEQRYIHVRFISKNQDIIYNQDMYLSINGKTVPLFHRKIRYKGYNQPFIIQKPVDVTQNIKTKKNRIEMNLQFEQSGVIGYIIVQLVKPISIDTVIDEILKREHFCSPKKSQSSDDIEELSYDVSFKCPLSFTRINQPGKTTSCTHIQCFELRLFIEYATQQQLWNCPVCHVPAYPSLLIHDTYFSKLLKEAPQDCSNITINPDGSYHFPGQVKKESSLENSNSNGSNSNHNSSSNNSNLSKSTSSISSSVVEEMSRQPSTTSTSNQLNNSTNSTSNNSRNGGSVDVFDVDSMLTPTPPLERSSSDFEFDFNRDSEVEGDDDDDGAGDNGHDFSEDEEEGDDLEDDHEHFNNHVNNNNNNNNNNTNGYHNHNNTTTTTNNFHNSADDFIIISDSD